MGAPVTRGCRGCGAPSPDRVLDLGKMPAADYFPGPDEPAGAAPGREAGHPLAMDLCRACGLAQLADDDTVTDEPRGIEPRALRDQAADALARVAGAGWLRGRTVREFGSPHGGSWLPLLAERGFTATGEPADVVVDCFGIMHEPDQRAAFARRAAALAPDGVLLLQFHALHAIVAQGQWNALRHGHFAYYSLAALTRLLADAGLRVVTAWEFDLYGGTVLVAAVRDPATAPGPGRPMPGRALPDHLAPDRAVTTLLETEAGVLATASGAPDLAAVRTLQTAADAQANALRRWLEHEKAAGRTVYAYGAASRAVALLYLAGVSRALLCAVADASPGKQGRRMPGTDVPIITPAELLAARPDRILLTLPDLVQEVRAQWPELDGRWVVTVPDS
ncbi:methyltransferase domain-containing protein [Nocardia sp. NPDC057668]|uniref:methyltransferase domain-containing protein n=1 Tax=Nocardia sp. NPDC057668 TaxID=3346202 RepID=UPI003671E259